MCVSRCEEVEAVDGGRLGCELLVYDGDLAKKFSQGVTEFVQGGVDFPSGCGVGEFVHYSTEFLAVVGAGLCAAG